jgi:hypothetical protein
METLIIEGRNQQLKIHNNIKIENFYKYRLSGLFDFEYLSMTFERLGKEEKEKVKVEEGKMGVGMFNNVKFFMKYQ